MPDMIFGVASVSKGFTALAIMQLAEAGRLSVDDPVVRYLPGYRTRDAAGSAATTLHHFLTHTAGLPPLPSRFFALARAAALDPFASARPAWVADHPPIDDADQLVDYLAELDVQPLGSPGEHFSYSNEGFALLGAIVERVAEQPFADYVTDHILTPLGMQRSSFDRRPLTGRPDVATLHAMREIGEADGPADVQPAELPTYVPLWYAAGGLNSTTRDLLRYLEIYRTGGVSHGARLLSADGIARMLTPHTRSTIPGTWYGYGLRLRPDYHGTRLVQHGGGSKGISSQVMVAPDRGITAVALTNLADVPSERLALAPVNTLLGLPVDTPPDEYPTAQYPVSTMARYAGSYRGGEGTEVRVALPGDQLMVTLGGRELPARPVGDHGVLVSPPSGEAYLQFLVSDGSPAWAVSVNSRILPRVE
jgi:CubicO group peptidase (beta-lactamase class C family)